MKAMVAVLFTLFLAGLFEPSFAQSKKNVTVDGEVIELTSYVREGIKPSGPAGKEIALENVRKGGALAFLEMKTNKVYMLAPASGDTSFVKTLSTYFGMPAFITGTLYTRRGVNLLVVSDIGKSIKK